MDRYRRRMAMLSVGAQLGCPVRRRIEGEIEIARPVEIVFEITRSHTATRFFGSGDDGAGGGASSVQRLLVRGSQAARRQPHRRLDWATWATRTTATSLLRRPKRDPERVWDQSNSAGAVRAESSSWPRSMGLQAAGSAGGWAGGWAGGRVGALGWQSQLPLWGL
jgi:hypothetical protein